MRKPEIEVISLVRGCDKVTVRISSKKMREGINHSLRKSTEHLLGAEALISINNLNDAVALTEFAIEELGRAVALREKLEVDSEEVENDLFTSHDYKYKKAWSILPEKLKTVYEKVSSSWGGWWGDAWEGWWGEGRKETISPKTRLDAIFVNYDESNEEWKVGIQVDKEKLKAAINGIRQCILEISNSKCAHSR